MASSGWGGSRPGAGRPQGRSKGEPVSIRLPSELLAEVDRQAREAGVSRSEIVARLLSRAIEAPVMWEGGDAAP